MALRVSESKFWDHFSIQSSPKTPKRHLRIPKLGTQIGPQKVNCAILCFFIFLPHFPFSTGHFFNLPAANNSKNNDFKRYYKNIYSTCFNMNGHLVLSDFERISQKSNCLYFPRNQRAMRNTCLMLLHFQQVWLWGKDSAHCALNCAHCAVLTNSNTMIYCACCTLSL